MPSGGAALFRLLELELEYRLEYRVSVLSRLRLLDDDPADADTVRVWPGWNAVASVEPEVAERAAASKDAVSDDGVSSRTVGVEA